MVSKPVQSGLAAAIIAAGTVLIVMILLARVPDCAALAHDPDWGHQLAGAQQILAGEHPFVDFNVTYGPLCFYSSAFAQMIGGHRVIAEVLLCLFGYAVGYGLLFLIALRLTSSHAIALVTLAAVLGAEPRLYKYYLLLGPTLTAGCALFYLYQPNDRRRLVMLAGAATITGLFRADFGAYVTAAASITVVLASTGSFQQRLRCMGLFLGLVLVIASPWLIWLASRGGLTNYILCSTIESLRHSQGLSLPMPVLSGASRPTAILFWLAPILPLLCILVAFFGFRHDPLHFKGVIVISLFALFSTSQAFHRSDLGHLIQAIPLHFILLGWLTACAYSYLRHRQLIWGAMFVLLAFACFLMGGLAGLKFARPDLGAVNSGLRNLAGLNARPEIVVAEALARYPEDPYLAMLVAIRKASTPQDRLFIVPYALGAYYFSGRLFAGNQMGLTPGYFTSATREAVLCRSLAVHPPKWVIDAPAFAFDGRSERNPRQFSPGVISFIERHYLPVQSFGEFTLREWRPADAPTAP